MRGRRAGQAGELPGPDTAARAGPLVPVCPGVQLLRDASRAGAPRNAEPRKHSELAWAPAHRLPDDVVPYGAQALAAYLDGRTFSLHAWPEDGPAAMPPADPPG
ncbi:NUDIX hydrolase [Marinitenerispora sediminis]|uniref:hypothetical protein n=1 Tax=Marinitenerispora sediminis TaxID=1931232 RepID=UPI000E0183FC|nr:hypothetical protein [Marinitenerispora sediminis]RCV49758.1 hypothetical protein DEF23_23180 [Marinitenerispora sediminis]